MTLSEKTFYRARITRRRDVSPDLWKIRVDPGGEFPFTVGQFATLGVETPAKHFERAYSIVSAPFEKEVEIFIELVQDGNLTPLLYKLQAGDAITLRKAAKGLFTLDTKSGHKNHLLLCTVTGIAPFISFARSLYEDWKEKNSPESITFI
ncbi:MAG: FAD-binding oxidoreductase [Candidatus Acidiferrales bacterium]